MLLLDLGGAIIYSWLPWESSDELEHEEDFCFAPPMIILLKASLILIVEDLRLGTTKDDESLYPQRSFGIWFVGPNTCENTSRVPGVSG